ncbi:MAG: hypothetical protein ACKOGN_08545 [Gammaproteobacteria bacterium]
MTHACFSWLRLRVLVGGLFLWATGAIAGAETSAEGIYVLPDRPVWAGEVFEWGLEWRIDRAAFRGLDGELLWNAEPLTAEAWTKPMLAEQFVQDRSLIKFKRAAMATQRGRIELKPASLGFLLQTGTVVNDDYTRAVLEPIRVQSQATKLSVRALPVPPPGFRGAVGQFRLSSTVDRAQVRTGEVVTWTLSLAGRGNWPMVAALPARAVPPGLQVRATERIDEKVLGEFARTRRESLSIVVSEPGTYRLPAVELPIFEPTSGQYRTLVAPALTLQATGAPATVAVIEQELLADDIDVIQPLAGRWQAIAPISTEHFDRWSIVGVLLLMVSWVGFACWRAWQLDPYRTARAAYRRLKRLTRRLTQIDMAGPLPDPAGHHLRQWQSALAVVWGVSGRAPTSRDFVGCDPWYSLWVESDAGLYGPTRSMPQGWSLRASAAVERLSAPPPFAWRRLLQVPYWWPRVLASALLFAMAALVHSPQSPAQTVIESGAKQVEQDPLDVIARYNLALGLEAEGRLSEAAVHSGIVWWQEPRFEAGGKLWVRLRSQAGLLSAAAGGLPDSAGVAARLRSVWPPGLWQRLQIAAGLTVFVLALFLMTSAYLRPWRRALPASAFCLSVAVLGFALASAITAASRDLLDSRAVVLHRQSILRELPVENRLDAGGLVFPGAVAIVERRFLTWVEIRLADGRRGWVRRESVTNVWQSK